MKMILLAITVFLCSRSFAQIEVSDNSNFKKIGQISSNRAADVADVELHISIPEKGDTSTSNDTMYAIRFYDMSARGPMLSSPGTRRYSIYFKNTNNAIGLLYKILLNVFTDDRYKDNNYETVLRLGNSTVTVKRDFYSSKPKIQCIVGDAEFIIKNEKELNGLFGK